LGNDRSSYGTALLQREGKTLEKILLSHLMDERWMKAKYDLCPKEKGWETSP